MQNIVTAVHDEGIAFNVQTRSGHHLRVEGASAAIQSGPGPMELLLVGLATCGSTNVVEMLEKMRQSFSSLEVDVSAERAPEPPRIWTDIHVHYRLVGDVDPRRLERAIWLSDNKICSAHTMLAATANIESTFEISGGS
ncbi:MAG: OsmC family protein [Acidimicrobiia bacterium]|nr:OsmC family protein [Acidimicrobiia bacterium]